MNNKELYKFTAYPDYSIRQVMEIINNNWQEIALIIDKSDVLIGVVTDGDIRRALLKGLDLNSTINKVMNTNFISVDIGVERNFVLDIMKANVIRQVPIIDENKKLVGIHLMDELIGSYLKPNTAVIMAGGKGTRLYPLTKDCPKPMIPVAGRPILERIIIHLTGFGIRKIFISVNYLSHVIEDFFGNGSKYGCSIEYIKEEKYLGTAGSLSVLRGKLTVPILVLNGDLVTQINIQKLLDTHNKNNNCATMVVKTHSIEIPYGVITCDGDFLKEIHEKPIINNYINAGIYVLDPSVLSLINPGEEFLMTSLFHRLLNQEKKLGVYFLDEDWIDVGIHDQLKKVNGIF